MFYSKTNAGLLLPSADFLFIIRPGPHVHRTVINMFGKVAQSHRPNLYNPSQTCLEANVLGVCRPCKFVHPIYYQKSTPFQFEIQMHRVYVMASTLVPVGSWPSQYKWHLVKFHNLYSFL